MVKLDGKTTLVDRITGFKGIAVQRSVHLNGCVRIELQSEKLKDGVPLKSQWIDESQLLGQEKDKPR